MFQCKHIRYIWDEQTFSFVKLKGLDVDVPLLLLHQLKALDAETRNARREVRIACHTEHAHQSHSNV